MKRFGIILILMVAVVATAFAVLRNGHEALAPMYQLASVTRRDIVVSASAAGTVEPIRTVEVKSKASGEIFEMPVETGDAVTTGQLLARVDPRVPQATLRQAEADLTLAQAQLENAEAQLRRAEGLFETESITEQEYDTAKLSVASARAQLVRAERSLEDARIAAEDTEVRAPINGVIIQKFVEEGTVITSATMGVSGGTILLQMANLDTVQVRALVDETDIGKIRPGLDVTITVDAFKNRPFDGKVLKIEPQSTVAQNVTMFPVLVRIPNSDALLKPGMNVEAEFHVGFREGVLAIPNAALRTDADVLSATQVLGLDIEVVQQQIAEARQAETDGASGVASDGAEATSSGETIELRGRRVPIPEGVDAEQARALAAKLEGASDPRSVFQSLSAEERQLMQRLMGGGPGMGGGAQSREEVSSTDAALMGGRYVVFALQGGIPQPVPVTTGITDLDYSEIVSGLTQSDTVLILPSTSLIESQQEMQERMSRFRGGGIPGISRN
ncbi:MAG: efflux RND transporter periplasmic adaptor subunit [Gemmatimonadota bacterium]|nr:MAG: efflux RND transporter periplasmic adaptor subunit [Gemmatimonadota bacterium]